jgi:hypothetical protein
MANPTFSSFALPITGVPIVFESIEEHTGKLEDGTLKKEVATTKTYRDSTGRMRIERNVNFGGGSVFLIQIFDHAEGFMTLLETGSKTAHRVTMPKLGQPGAQGPPRFMFTGPLVALPGEKTCNTESLGTQTIAGAEFEGHRITTTIQSQPSVVGVQEHWRSMELGLIGLTSSSGPDGEESVRIQRLERTEPDPTLFVIPLDYSVVEVGHFGLDA